MSPTLAAVLIAGCGGGADSDVGAVRGRVTLDGKPLPNALIEFDPVKAGRSSTAQTDDAGEYKLQYSAKQAGALVGQHTVRVSTGGLREDPATGKLSPVPEILPAKYHADSTMTREVKSGDNEVNIELTSK